MKRSKRERLEAGGWRFGDAGDLLELSPEEREFIRVKIALADLLRAVRANLGWTQTQVARRIRSNQSRVSRMEACDESVSVDLILRTLLALGTTRDELVRALAPRPDP